MTFVIIIVKLVIWALLHHIPLQTIRYNLLILQTVNRMPISEVLKTKTSTAFSGPIITDIVKSRGGLARRESRFPGGTLLQEVYRAPGRTPAHRALREFISSIIS